MARWKYACDCDKCKNCQYTYQPEKSRNGMYCQVTITNEDAGTPYRTIWADDATRTVRCDHYEPAQIEMEESK